MSSFTRGWPKELQESHDRWFVVKEPSLENKRRQASTIFERTKERLRLACAQGKFPLHELSIKIADSRLNIMQQMGVALPEYHGEPEKTINHALEPPPPLDQKIRH